MNERPTFGTRPANAGRCQVPLWSRVDQTCACSLRVSEKNGLELFTDISDLSFFLLPIPWRLPLVTVDGFDLILGPSFMSEAAYSEPASWMPVDSSIFIAAAAARR